MAKTEHGTAVGQLGRFGEWLACKLLEIPRTRLYASRCHDCRWVGPARLDPWAAEIDGLAHEHEEAG